MDTRTGEIRELGPDEKPNEYETLLTRKERRRLELLTPIARIAALAAMRHPSARPDGLTDEEWITQKNAAKRQRRARRAG
jgi:hypothetical protein